MGKYETNGRVHKNNDSYVVNATCVFLNVHHVFILSHILFFFPFSSFSYILIFKLILLFSLCLNICVICVHCLIYQFKHFYIAFKFLNF